jgi:Cys-tRNA(Pro) deacylase
MTKQDYPVTTAIRELRQKKIEFEVFLCDYEEKGGTRHTAKELNVPEHSIVKTLVMETEAGKGLIILMHGDCEVSTKELSRVIGAKKVIQANQQSAMKMTGYQFGGTSPFGLRTKLPVYAEKSIFDLELIYINGGKRGFIIGIKPDDLRKAIYIEEVNVRIG